MKPIFPDVHTHLDQQLAHPRRTWNVSEGGIVPCPPPCDAAATSVSHRVKRTGQDQWVVRTSAKNNTKNLHDILPPHTFSVR